MNDYLIQFLAIQFAITLAFKDAESIKVFERNGIFANEMSRFHRYGLWAKVFFCAVVVLSSKGWAMIMSGLFAFSWLYLVFDIALNLRRRLSWDYLGQNDADGRWWLDMFGSNAGQYKASFLFIVIIILNVVKLL